MKKRKLLYVDKELKVVSDAAKGVAVVDLIKEQEFLGDGALGNIFLFNKLVNIAFLASIGQDKDLQESDLLRQKWAKENYPAYLSSLISSDFCFLARRLPLAAFDNCWTRSRQDEGYPCYRSHPVLCKDRIIYEEDYRQKMPNVYVSLVMPQEEFVALNPEVRLEDYYVI